MTGKTVTVLAAFLGAVVLASCVVAPAAPPPSIRIEAAGPPAEFAVFQDSLDPYGHWFVYGSYGWVWAPTVVAADWRPYMYGHWVWTDDGWLWVSDEPFGWATYHYGRWIYDGALGWIWVPDTDWGPGWVCWRDSDVFIGWAPMPPGLVMAVGVHTVCDPWMGAWVFVDYDFFVYPHVDHYCLPPSRNDWIAGRTRPITTTARHESPGPSRERVADRTGQPVVAHHIDTIPPGAGPSGVDEGDRVTIVRPPSFPREVRATRIPQSPGAARLDQPPIDGQHRPEVGRTSPSNILPLPPADRGNRVPAAPSRPAPKPKPKPQPPPQPQHKRDEAKKTPPRVGS